MGARNLSTSATDGARYMGYEDVLMDVAVANNLVHTDDRESFISRNMEAARDRKPFNWEGRFLAGDGVPRQLRIESTPIVLENGDIQWFGVTHDITERKQAEEALIESEALFRGMFQDHSAVMLLVDPGTGQIIKANKAATSYYGYPQEIMLEKKIQQLNTLSPEEVAKEMGSALNRQFNIFKFRHRLADGQVRDVEVHSAPITIQHQTLLTSPTARRLKKKSETTFRKRNTPA
jgi:PAS domain S-box-containing protein